MNIRQRILASGAIGIVAVVLLGGVGFWGQLRLGKALSENELTQTDTEAQAKNPPASAPVLH